MDTFEKIYFEYYADIFWLHMKLTNYDKTMAEELTQETFFQAYKSISNFKGESQIKTWLYSIGKNVFRKNLRKNKQTFDLDEMQIIDTNLQSTTELVEHQEIINIVYSIIDMFPKKMSKVMIMRIVEELPYNTIAAKLGISVSSAKVLYHRGKLEIKKKLKEEYNYEI